MVPVPGRTPIQFDITTKRNIVITNGKKTFPLSSPAIFLHVLYMASNANSIRFCKPLGTTFMFFVARLEISVNINIDNKDISKVFVNALFRNSYKNPLPLK